MMRDVWGSQQGTKAIWVGNVFAWPGDRFRTHQISMPEVRTDSVSMPTDMKDVGKTVRGVDVDQRGRTFTSGQNASC